MLAKDADPKKMANKLHKQFAHPTPTKLIELMRKAEMSSAEIESEIKIISENCVVCKNFKNPVPRPLVSLYIASKFNEAISMDLKVWHQNLYFFVIVDVATIFCVVKVIHDKIPQTIIKSLTTAWI